MKLKSLFSALLLGCAMMAQAQSANDPTIMTINGQPISRSEFEYSYNKNNSEGVIDKKSVEEYVDLFINYKLKVQAAIDAKMDTMPAYKREFLNYRDQQIRPTIINDADVEAEAYKIYKETQERIDGAGGMRQVSHILIMVPPKATAEEMTADSARADSIYSAIMKGLTSTRWREDTLTTRHRQPRAASSTGSPRDRRSRLLRTQPTPCDRERSRAL